MSGPVASSAYAACAGDAAGGAGRATAAVAVGVVEGGAALAGERVVEVVGGDFFAVAGGLWEATVDTVQG